MAENTIQVKAYFPTGAWATISLAFDSLGTMPTAGDIIAGVEAKGFSIDFAGVEAGEQLEVMTHVSRRMHTNKKDGTVTPVIAFYHENTALNWKYDHVYMNTDEQIAEFEQLSGVKISDIPEWEANSFLDRSDTKASKYIIALPSAVKVATAEKEYKKQDGTTDTTMKIQRLIGASNQPSTPANVTAMPTSTSEQRTANAGWLKNDKAIESVKQGLAELLLSYSEDNISSARAIIDPNMKSYGTPKLYLEALENQIKTIGA